MKLQQISCDIWQGHISITNALFQEKNSRIEDLLSITLDTLKMTSDGKIIQREKKEDCNI